MTLRPFHYAFVVDDLAAARVFYREVVGCGEGRSSDRWIDFDMFGHQIVAHLCVEPGLAKPSPTRGTGPLPSFSERPGDVQDFGPTSQSEYPMGDRPTFQMSPGHLAKSRERAGASASTHNKVDGHDVPVPHFGVMLTVEDFTALAARFADAGIAFIIPPTVRFAGQAGEQHTMFLHDPAGNALEFKAFADDAALFAVD